MIRNWRNRIRHPTEDTETEKETQTLTHLPITLMRNHNQYGKSIRGVSGLAVEESKMHTFSRIQWIIFSEKYLSKM